MKCPKCGEPCEEIVEEVDIGVGIQRFSTGWECERCQWGTGLCNWCGVPTAPEAAREHHGWCSLHPEAEGSEVKF